MKAQSNICQVYFFYGPEEYLIEEEIQRLLKQTLSQKEKGLNLHLFHGEEHSSQEMVQTAQTLPMFSPYRFVLVRKADHMDEKEVDGLMEYIQKPSPSTCLVLWGQTIGLWKKHRKQIEAVGKISEFKRLKGMALVSWVKRRMLEKGKILTEEASGYLVEIVGDHLSDLENTLEKVFLSVGEKRNIDLSDIEEINSEAKVSTVFDLTEAIGCQNLEKALEILEKTIESKTVVFKKEEEGSKFGDPIPLFLSMMARQYWRLLVIKQMSSHDRDSDGIAKRLGTSPWNIKKLMDQGKNFSEASLLRGIQNCHQTDLAIKRSRGPKDLLMEKLVIDLCRPGTPKNVRPLGKS